MPSILYLDSPASTRLDREVAAAMQTCEPGNPHATHVWGVQASARIEQAQQEVQNLVGPGRLVFTSGATEANSLALLGMALRELRLGGTRRTLLACATEHASVLNLKRLLKLWGFELRVLPVLPTGHVDLEALDQALSSNVLMLSIMTVNNETGVTQDWDALYAVTGRIPIHTDAAQALGKNVALPANADLITLSAHKMHGPQGIGALLIRKGPKPDPLLHGGDQQHGLRSGTMPTALCVGFGACCRIAQERCAEDRIHVRRLSQTLLQGVFDIWPKSRRIGERCVDGIICMQLPGALARTVLSTMPQVAASTGSACHVRSDKVSHVLKAMRVRHARSCLRLGISRMTSATDIDTFLSLLAETRDRLL